MCKDANSDVLKESLLKMIYHDAESVPEYIYMRSLVAALKTRQNQEAL